MKICAICSNKTNDATCPACGEASWLEARVQARGLRQDVVMQDEVDDVDAGSEVIAPKRSRQSRSSK